MQNQYGLSRNVPSHIKRAIRQRCGFGCVLCGLAFYDYEHFNPDFVDAREHNPEGMTLLCPNCNQKRARGRLSAASVADANANPRCLQQGFANESFDFGGEPIEVKFAGSSYYNCRHIIVINDLPILTVAPPLNPGEPVRLSGVFVNDQGRVTLRIIDNRFLVNTNNWDVECVGPQIKIRDGIGEIALHIEMAPPNGIAIRRIEMRFQGVHLRGDDNALLISVNGSPWSRFAVNEARDCDTGMLIENGPRAANDPLFDFGE